MDYEKLYKKALAHAREIHRNEEEKRHDMEWLFPELKESENERIRKALIHFFSNPENTLFEYWEGIPKKEVLAWLEKQSKPTNEIHYWTEEEIEPIISDYLRGAEHYGGMICRLRCLKPKSLEEQGEQKHSNLESNGEDWSEEDEKEWKEIVELLQYHQREDYINFLRHKLNR